MKIRTRKAIGTLLTVVFIAVYCLIIMALGAIVIVGKGIFFELPFYILAGLGWLPFVMAIIKWMSKPDN
jgi:Protein of unknown function (DUF2842)